LQLSPYYYPLAGTLCGKDESQQQPRRGILTIGYANFKMVSYLYLVRVQDVSVIPRPWLEYLDNDAAAERIVLERPGVRPCQPLTSLNAPQPQRASNSVPPSRETHGCE